ncbi:glycosyl transferase family 1 [Brasilonema octagenarum UFV-E1]|uniref:Glycosyl transferase family 1 n=2 Tax=Brasilonema TaxID=383614 RepID=A0A856MBF9_9CYAN|nr:MULTISPECIES: glycosyltransferase [Brasilonema]NMF64815.1 glycosyl transferase family 1 [Brasilonema octagenarum UFV-OR1]QDL08048.1 glycosyl transferase family 1 [Brasilonema sennae CENA114]QDL14407.1 glycosyl transferase family 1 [Brasilonema octagenarum UFV-E1]
MKVIIIMPLAEQRGGSEMTLRDLMQEGRNAGVEWLVIFLEDGPMVELFRKFGVDARVVRGGRVREVHRLLMSAIAIASIARREHANVIISWMWLAHLTGGLAALLAGIPAMWYQQEIPDNKNFLKRLVNLMPARGVVTITKAIQSAQSQILPERPVYLVNPGVALDRFNPSDLPSPSEARSKLGLPLDGPLIGIVGRMQRWKGIHVLVEAMPKVLQKYPNAHCVVVGGKHDLEPDYEDFLNEKIATLGLPEKVLLAGLQRNIPEWVQAMDVFVHASDNEPFGIVIIEAMALGKPIIAGNAGGPTEIITNGLNGLLTPYGDANALADAILRYLNDQEFARTAAQAARQRALDFSTQRYAQNFIHALRSAV